MRFDLVDQVLEYDGDRVVTVKSVTASEEYLGDHFPTFPVLPGVMMLEAMVQAARRMLEADPETARQGPWVLAEVKQVRYGNMVRPGEQLRLTVTRATADARRRTFKGVGAVREQNAVQGRFVLTPARLGPSTPQQ